jgi:hypothetical protein
VKKITQHAQKNEVLDDRAHLIRIQKEKIALQQKVLDMEKMFQSKIESEKAHMENFYREEMKKLQNKVVFTGSSQEKKQEEEKKLNREEIKRRQSWHPSASSNRMSLAFPLNLAPVNIGQKKILTPSPSLSFGEPKSAESLKRILQADESSKILSPELSFPSPSVIPKRRTTVRFHEPIVEDDDSDSEEVDTESPPRNNFVCMTRRKKSVTTSGLGSILESPFFEGESFSVTPHKVLRQRLSLKVDEVTSLRTELQELQEFTKLENEVVQEERKSYAKFGRNGKLFNAG